MDSTELKSALLFNRVTNYTPLQKFDLYRQYKSFTRIVNERNRVEKVSGKPFAVNGEVIDIEKMEECLEKEIDYCTRSGVEIITIENKSYPAKLRYISDPPLILFVKGNKELLNRKYSVAVVGARKASNMSITLTYAVSKELSGADVTVVSGLACGVDHYAHMGAADEPGSTVAVLGNGIDVVYPKQNREMYEKIADRGCMITEFSTGTPPLKYNFPKRNRIISGLVLGVVVIEASRKSGALITAQYALDQGREVMAFPGRASSEYFSGNNYLIKEGAHLVENASDILSILGKKFDYKRESSKLSFTSLEQDILNIIGDGEVSVEDIGKLLTTPISKIVSTLMLLELRGIVAQHPGKFFSRVMQYEN